MLYKMVLTCESMEKSSIEASQIKAVELYLYITIRKGQPYHANIRLVQALVKLTRCCYKCKVLSSSTLYYAVRIFSS